MGATNRILGPNFIYILDSLYPVCHRASGKEPQGLLVGVIIGPIGPDLQCVGDQLSPIHINRLLIFQGDTWLQIRWVIPCHVVQNHSVSKQYFLSQSSCLVQLFFPLGRYVLNLLEKVTETCLGS